MVVLACASGAGAHAGLVPEHLRETPGLGVAFIAAAVLLMAGGAVLAIRPASGHAARGAALLLGGVIASYAVSRTIGIPLIQPTPEPVDVVGMATTLVEALGLGFALWLIQPAGARHAPAAQEATR